MFSLKPNNNNLKYEIFSKIYWIDFVTIPKPVFHVH